jgi:uncharacterized protein DUF302
MSERRSLAVLLVAVFFISFGATYSEDRADAQGDQALHIDGAAPNVALNLPLKILVSEDAQGKVWLSYNSPEYLKERHGLPPDPLPNVAVIETLTAAAGK